MNALIDMAFYENTEVEILHLNEHSVEFAIRKKKEIMPGVVTTTACLMCKLTRTDFDELINLYNTKKGPFDAKQVT